MIKDRSDTSLITYCDCSDSQPSIHFIFPPPLVLWTFVLVINICVHVQLSIHNIIIRAYDLRHNTYCQDLTNENQLNRL